MRMKLSIVIPVFNVEKYLSRCLDSIVDQELDVDEHEILVVIDGSPDNSRSIANEYARRYSQIKVINQPNLGVSGARNTGINRASGKYLYFIDPDDYLERKVLNKLLTIAEDKKLDFFGFDAVRTSKADYVDSSHLSVLDKEAVVLNGVSFISKYNFNNGPWWYLVRREVLENTGLRFEINRMVEDGIFTTEVLLHSSRTMFTPLKIYRYFYNNNSITTNRRVEHTQKLNNDFTFVVNKFNYLIDLAILKGAKESAVERLKARQQSYSFFLIVRLLKTNISRKELFLQLEILRQHGGYPLNRFIGIDYSSKKEKLLTFVFNTPSLLLILYYVNRIFKIIS